jgi:hypothetical protein
MARGNSREVEQFRNKLILLKPDGELYGCFFFCVSARNIDTARIPFKLLRLQKLS